MPVMSRWWSKLPPPSMGPEPVAMSFQSFRGSSRRAWAAGLAEPWVWRPVLAPGVGQTRPGARHRPRCDAGMSDQSSLIRR